jgi:hypothetical protein
VPAGSAAARGSTAREAPLPRPIPARVAILTAIPADSRRRFRDPKIDNLKFSGDVFFDDRGLAQTRP